MAHILVIDDDQDILRLLEFALNRAGHKVSIASNGAQGLAEIDSQKPDLIVADVMMPHMTGYDFCRQVRAKSGAAEIPIIIFSARFQPIDKQTALQAGATDYLPKSTSPNVLVQRIEELLPAPAGPVSNPVIGFFSLRGGAGVTSLAVNVAIALAVTQKNPVGVVDLVPVGGHAALMLGLRPNRTFADVLAAGDHLSPEMLKSYLINHKSGVDLLASSLNLESRLAPQTHQLEQLALLFKAGFTFSVFDLASWTLESPVAAMLPKFDKIALILTPEMAALQSTAIGLQALAQLDIPESKVLLVVNHTFPQNGLPLETIQKVLKRPVAATIPFEPDMIKALNSGQPLLLSNPKSAGAAAIARLATILLS